MKALVIYESMFGSTHELADAIADGLRDSCEVDVIRADEVQQVEVDTADLLVVGGPTHAHSLSTEASRREAARMSTDPGGGLHLEDPSMTEGLRGWLDDVTTLPTQIAAFDTRSDMPRLLTGAASKRIERELRHKGAVAVVPAESFLVEKYAGLKAGELERGRAWGRTVAEKMLATAASE
ncbi:hypothetical protein IWX78_000805 [Mycetocola sp. CAN_C7]|uniref:flavodoxin domain-containing protein n=1 Tax=Mycetocola sp. CAN_C7 TaxID=2787724 RepID=UPI0018CBA219